MPKRKAGTWRNEVAHDPPKVRDRRPLKPLPGQLDLFQGKPKTEAGSAVEPAEVQTSTKE